jgi:hypothetical protein
MCVCVGGGGRERERLCNVFILCSDFLDTHIYLTRGWKDNQAFAIMLREGDDRDAITGLQAKTHFGRPDWPNIFDEISLSHRRYEGFKYLSTRPSNKGHNSI